VINVLVQETVSPSGTPRYEIRKRDGSQAASGVNWRGERFAELYLEADPEAEVQGLAISVLAAMAGRMLREHVIPVFRLEDDSMLEPSALEDIGFRSTGSRSFVAQAIPRPKPEDGSRREGR
jgi:hypothetical protein